jgi:hypothetical protein
VNLYPPGPAYFDEVEVDLVCEMLDRGFSVEATADAVFDFWEVTDTRNTSYYRKKALAHVKAIDADRWNWHASRNPATMQQAFEGRKGAWDELNHYERKEVVLRIQALLDSGRPHPSFPDYPIIDTSGRGSGLTLWCQSVGLEDPQHITNPFGRRDRIRKANAEAKADARINA